MSDTDRVSDLDLTTPCYPRGDDALGDPPRRYDGERSTFDGSLPEKAPPP